MNGPEVRVKAGIAGATIRYPCPNCNEPLVSRIGDAGGMDTCPKCNVGIVVPGQDERLKWETQRRHKEAVKQRLDEGRREAEQQRREYDRARTVEIAASKAAVEKRLQLDRDPLKEWYWQFALAVVILVVVCGRHMIAAVATDNTYLCAIICVLFLIGLVVNYLNVRQLRIEYVCAAVCVQRLQAKGGFADVLSSQPAGVFHRHVQDLGAIAKYDQGLTQDCLITLLYSRLMARSRIVDILSNVLVSLGLIGTILGLITMTNGLSGTLESLGDGNDSTLMSGLRGTMSGLGTAFYTTLVGAMFGSVVLRILNNVYTSNVDHLVSYVASTAEVKIVPRLKQARKSLPEKQA